MARIQTRDGIVIDIGDADPNDPGIRQMVEQERAGRKQRRMESPEFKAKVAEEEERTRATLDPTEGMSGLDKVRANLGAGFASAGQGAQQLLSKVGIMQPVSDEEVLEKRRRDEALAKSTETGAGGKYVPSIGTALQFAGEVAPTLVIPAGAATGTAARVLPRALQAAVRTPLRAGMTGGAVSGALMPTTEDESKLLNVGMGTAGGAALPLAVSAVRGGRRLFSPQARAGERLREIVGDTNTDVQRAVAERSRERAGQAPTVRAIPETLAEASGSTGLGRLESELGRAEATADEMAAFKRRQNVARHEAVQAATSDADRLLARDQARAAVSNPAREAAIAAAGQDQFFQVPAVQAVQRVMSSDASANPAVRRVADFVMSSMDERAGTAITPGRLHEVRKVLVDALEGPTRIGDEMSAAVKGSQRETMELIRGIDEALNTASGGRWDRWRELHQRASRPVDEARAAQEARAIFQREGMPELGGAPEVTAGRMGAAMRAAAGGEGRQFPLTLSASAQRQMEDISGQIGRANEVQRARKLAGTAGGGSQTSTDIDKALRQIATKSGIPLIGPLLEEFGGRMADATKVELMHLVQDPNAAMVALRQAQRLRQPLSEAQQLFLTAAGRSAAGGLPLALQAEQGGP